MARQNDGIVKKNSKLEAFLKRHLNEDGFERIRGHERCIVVSEKEDKALKFVVLSDEWIYLTEDPPKTIQRAVHLDDVVSVRLVSFLNLLFHCLKWSMDYYVLFILTCPIPKNIVMSKEPLLSHILGRESIITHSYIIFMYYTTF